MTKWSVHKFGGTSMADAARIAGVADLVRAAGPHTAVVVSAMAGVTNALFSCCTRAAARDPAWQAELDALVARHVDVAAALAPDHAERLAAVFARDAADLKDILRAIALLGSHPEALDEVVAGHGEVWSAQLLAARLGCAWIDARKVLVVAPAEMGPAVQWERSRSKLEALPEGSDPVVITGYVASLPDGTPTTLKRNGSDFSASIFGALLDAKEIVIWTDVDGVLSADPRRVPEAVLLDEMSYAEAMELAYFGAKVVHPRTMQPAVERNIPIWIKNTFRPEVKGTVIKATASTPASLDVKGFTTIDNIALLNLEGTGMVGVPGIAERLFGALRGVGVSVSVISQASSEHSICVAIPDAQAELAQQTVERAFTAERAQGHVQNVVVQRDCSIVAAVGDAMAERAGVAARFFGALGDANVNIRAVAQGSSERNITAVIDARDSTRALRAVHSRFTLSATTLSVGVIGTGGIGQALLAQLEAQRDVLRERFRVDLRVRAIASSSRMLLDESANLARFASSSTATDLSSFGRAVRAEHLPHAVIVDCSASDTVVDHYAEWLARGIHVVTPNKRAASGPLARWRAIQQAAKSGRARYFGEATVGAGLPVIATLKDLLNTGDRVLAVEGVLSGTLSWMFNTLDDTTTFSALLREARERGFTEPDPREDLSGLDVARKLVVLAREMGRDVSLEDVVVEDLAPGLPFGAPIDELVAGLKGVDDKLAALVAQARAEGGSLRYVGTVPEVGAPSVALRLLPSSHPFSGLRGTDNVIAFRTARYSAQPLVVQGPGAGREVTAGGVFGDLLRLAAHVGAVV
ncbi:MAG TPA: bifunctional aspartate kinase/homoserine dehydrogenase I [Myxococcota bacterium]